METNTSSENRLILSFSKKEVRFCDKISILHYTIEDSVESLNNSAISMMNENSLLCPSTCITLKNSSEVISSHAECIANQCLDNLPEAVVILEKVPEDLIQKHSYLDSVDIECCSVPMAIQSTDESCSLNSDLLHEKMTDSMKSQTSLAFKKEKYSLLNLKVSIPRLPDNFREIYGCHVSEKISSETVKHKSKCSTSAKTFKNVHSISDSSSNKDEIPLISKTKLITTRTCSKNPGNKVSKLNGIVKNAKTKSCKISRNQNIKHSESTQHSLLQNSFDRLPSPSKIECSKCVGKNCTQVIGIAKSVDSNASVFKKYFVNQENHNEVTFDKYPCIHLEKLDFGPYLEGTSRSFDYFQSKNGVPMNLELDVGNAANISDFSKPKESVQLKNENCFKTLNLPAPIDVEYAGNLENLSDPEKNISLNEEVSNVNLSASTADIRSTEIFRLSKPKQSVQLNEDICSITINLSALAINVDSAENAPNTSDISKLEKSAPSNEEVCPKNINISVSIIDTEGDTANASELSKHEKSVLLNKEVSSESVKSVLPACYKKNFRDKSLRKKESIVKDINCEKSSLYKNAQNKVPYVLLERLPLTLVEMHMNYDTYFSEATCTGSVTNVSSTDIAATITDVPDLPIRIKNVRSISKKMFNKKQKKDKKNSNKSSLFYNHQFNENRAGVVKHKSKCSTSIKTIKNLRSISDPSSNEDEIPLISVSKKKLIHAHSFHDFEDSSSDDTSLENLANTNASLIKAKSSSISTHKHKKNNLMHNSQKCISVLKKKSPNLQTLCSISKKILKNKKCSKSFKLSHLEKKKKKKSSKKKRLKIYKLIMKYLKMQIKSKKHKKKSNKRKKSLQEKLVPSNPKNGIESDDSIAIIYDSNEKDCAKNKNGDLSSTSEKNTKTNKPRLHKKLTEKYRLGFLSNKVSLRFYNRFLASERLLLSNSKLKKNKKKKLKKLFSKLKTVHLASKIV